LWDAAFLARVGFLHTASAHAETFDLLMEELAPSLEREHLVRPALLQRARLAGAADRRLRLDVSTAIAAFRDPTLVLCTCSTIGGLAEQCGRERGVDVLRVDRPMAERAVRSGQRIAIVAALASTLAPTRTLLESLAREAELSVELVDAPCLDAWPLYEAGDEVGFHRRVASHVETLDRSCGAVVLAQASMEPAARIVSRAVPVLASPRLAVEAVYRLLTTERTSR
jgi:hypothetical protein